MAGERRWSSKQARKAAFIPVMRELVRAYQAFARFDAATLRMRGLTVDQADVLFTLGNTEGMTCKELGERTLITKGTLTGVIDRLQAKGLATRRPSPTDGRSTVVALTARGAARFEEVYPLHIAELKARFDRLGKDELARTRRTLSRLREMF